MQLSQRTLRLVVALIAGILALSLIIPTIARGQQDPPAALATDPAVASGATVTGS